MNRPLFDNSNHRRTRRWALVGLLLLAGCRTAVPPRYLGTWHRVTSKHYTPVIPYCHGYTPTFWSRWPDDCQGAEAIVVEEVPRPLPGAPLTAPPLPPSTILPPATAPPPTEPPFPTEDAGPPPPEDVIVPQQYTEPPVEMPAKKSKRQAPPSWSAHLQRYVSEITRMR